MEHQETTVFALFYYTMRERQETQDPILKNVTFIGFFCFCFSLQRLHLIICYWLKEVKRYYQVNIMNKGVQAFDQQVASHIPEETKGSDKICDHSNLPPSPNKGT